MEQPNENDIGPLMQGFAEIAVDVAQREFNVHLDYSERSLANVDEIIQARARDLPSGKLTEQQLDEIWQIAKVWGGYVGEVIRRNLNGVWKIQTLESGTARAVLVVAHLTGSPVEKVYKILTGEDVHDSAVGYYRVLKYLVERGPE
jgi:hypothetical protein